MKKFITPLLALLWLAGCGSTSSTKTASNHEYKVTSLPLHNTLHFTGTIQPLHEHSVICPMDAVIEAMPYHYGERVKKNDTLFTLNSTELQKQYNDALTEYLKAKDGYSISKAKFAGSKNLWDAGLLAKNTYISEKSSLNTAKITLLQSEQKLKEIVMQANEPSFKNLTALNIADFTNVQLALTGKHNKIDLRASFDGILLFPPKSDTDKTGRVGVGTAVKSNQVVALVGDLSGVSTEIDIPELDIDTVHVHMKASITGVALGNIPLKGEVVAVNAQASNTDSNTIPSFHAFIEVKNLTKAQQDHIRVGMSATVELMTDDDTQLLIPIAAVTRRGDRSVVQLKTKSGQLKWVFITTGTALADKVVVESGLHEGDVITYD